MWVDVVLWWDMRSPSLVLASASPRRLAMLRLVGLEPVVRPASVDERGAPSEPTGDYVRRVARDKALAAHAPGEWTLAADTVVDLDGARLGKPRDRADAGAMLRRLSGRAHVVTTGRCLLSPDGAEAAGGVVSTEVVFRSIGAGEAEAYLDTGEWTDKAGGYGVQGVAAMFVTELHGSWTNVVGLPLAEVACDLLRCGATGTLPAAGAGRRET